MDGKTIRLLAWYLIVAAMVYRMMFNMFRQLESEMQPADEERLSRWVFYPMYARYGADAMAILLGIIWPLSLTVFIKITPVWNSKKK
jgi:hypothetical protein